MIKIMKTNPQTMKLEQVETLEKNCWIHLISPDDNEVEDISRLTGISEQMIKTALDEEETAHVDIEDNVNMVVIDIPVIEEEDDWYLYTTVPLGIIYNNEYFLTVSLRENALIRDFESGRVKGFATFKQNRTVLQMLYHNAIKFLHYLRQIDRTSHRVQTQLHRSMKNKELIQLLDLEKSLVYFSTALRANDAVLARMQKFESVKKYEEDMELLEDVMIENKQAIEMCNIYRDILSGTMDAFASIISNNVNIVMKMLTLVTIVLAIPTLIFSFFGMNVGLPFEGFSFAWIIILVVTVIITTGVAVWLFTKTNNIKRK